MAVNKNFVVKNGLEVNTKLIRADATNNKVGIGTSVANYELHVNGGIGATDVHVSGMTTILTELNVGLGGTVLTVLGTGDQFVGINTASPQFRLDVRSPVSTGQTALYVYGDMRVTGDIELDDINLDDATIQNLTVTEALNVSNSGLSTFSGRADFNDSVDIEDNLIVAGIATVTKDITVSSNAIVAGLTTLTGAATLSNNATVGGTLGVTGGSTLSSDLIVSGLSTFSGISTFSGRVGVITDFVVDGNSTLTGLTTITGNLTASGDVAASSNLTVAGLTTITGNLTASGDVTAASNLNVTGIVTAAAFSGNITGVAATFTGNVTIGGTLTYEDVTNIDSVGVITAREGIKVLAGGINAVGVVTAETGIKVLAGGINAVGVVTATSFVGGGQIGVRSEGTFIGTGVTMVDFKSSGANNTVDFDSTAGIATVTVTTGVSLGLAIALGG